MIGLIPAATWAVWTRSHGITNDFFNQQTVSTVPSNLDRLPTILDLGEKLWPGLGWWAVAAAGAAALLGIWAGYGRIVAQLAVTVVLVEVGYAFV